MGEKKGLSREQVKDFMSQFDRSTANKYRDANIKKSLAPQALEKLPDNTEDLASLVEKLDETNKLVNESGLGIEIKLSPALKPENLKAEQLQGIEGTLYSLCEVIEKVKSGEVLISLPKIIILDNQRGVFPHGDQIVIGIGVTANEVIDVLPKVEVVPGQNVEPKTEPVVEAAPKVDDIEEQEKQKLANEIASALSDNEQITHPESGALQEIPVAPAGGIQMAEPVLEAGVSLDILRTNYARLLEQERINKKSGIENAGALELQEAEGAYYAALDQESLKIRDEVYLKHEIEGHGEVHSIQLERAHHEMKRRVMDEVVVVEHKNMMVERARLREGEKSVLAERVKEAMFKSLQWYASQNKYKRLAISTLLFGVAGYTTGFLGATAAVGYVGARGLRGLAAMPVMAAVNAGAQRIFSTEKAEAKGEDKKEKLKYSYNETDLKSAMGSYEKIEKETAADKKRRILAKSAVAFGAGAGLGFLSGAMDLNSHFGLGGSKTEITPESQSTPEPPVVVPPRPDAPIFNAPEETSVISELKPEPEIEPSLVQPTTSETSSLLPERIVELTPKKVNSIWKIAEEGLKDHPKFSSLDQAQKTYVISAITNRDLKDPTSYGLPEAKTPGAGPMLFAGQKINASEVIGSKQELDQFIEKAIKLSDSQKNSILGSTNSVKAFVEAHPDAEINHESVAEILNNKDKISISEEVAEVAEIELPKPKLDRNVYADTDHLSKPEIGVTRPSNISLDPAFAQQIEVAFRDDINSVYTEKAMFGLSKVPGIRTENWKFMSTLSAKKVLEFYTEDSNESDLSSDIQQELKEVPAHQKMLHHMTELVKMAEGKVVPSDRENVATYVKRLGGFILSNHRNNFNSAQLQQVA